MTCHCPNISKAPASPHCSKTPINPGKKPPSANTSAPANHPTPAAASAPIAGADLAELIGTRRFSDNLGALLHWTRRTLATHPDLADRSADGIAAYLRQRLGTDPMVGHAIAHIRHLFDPDDPDAKWNAYLDAQAQARAEELAVTSEPASP